MKCIFLYEIYTKIQTFNNTFETKIFIEYQKKLIASHGLYFCTRVSDRASNPFH